jgi:subtilisin family serine protease
MMACISQRRLTWILVAGFIAAALLCPFPPAQATTPDAHAPADTSSLAMRSQILERLGVKRWHAAGHLGKGIKVAILDSGFSGYRAHLGKALPERVTAHSFRSDGNLEAKDSQHGILCGEVIHTLAPEAELLLANWEPERPEQFLDAVRWAREQGARVVSCSVIMPSWSDCEGHGPVHEALSRLLGAGDGLHDLLCFASAGNTAQRHWSGPFHDDGDGRHEWSPGHTENAVTPWGGERVSVELCAPPGTGYEVAVYDMKNREVATGRSSAKAERCCAVAAFNPEADRAYRVSVRLIEGRPGSFHLVVLGGGLEHATSQGSVPFPGDGPEVIAVGAVDADGRRLAYSSCGPNSTRPKPDLAAVVPFPSAWRARPFSGTSAAAPQAAALAALLWSRHPDWTAGEVRETLRSSAQRPKSGEHDYETGFGRVRLP